MTVTVAGALVVVGMLVLDMARELEVNVEVVFEVLAEESMVDELARVVVAECELYQLLSA